MANTKIVRIRTCSTWNKSHNTPERSNKPSKTIPDQTYTPAEILKRYARGLPMEKLSSHYYSGDIDYPDIRRMDLTEQEDIVKKANRDVEQLNKDLADRIEANKKRQKAWAADQASKRAEHLKNEVSEAIKAGQRQPGTI